MERSKVVINIARINRINKNLNYLLGFKEDFITAALDPELSCIGLWALEIQAYWRECKDPIIAEQIDNIGSSGNFYKLLLSSQMADDVREAISLYVDTMKILKVEIQQHHKQSKGSYSMLPDELANHEAAMLLQRAIEAGLLREDYQPREHTSKAQLRFLAYGVGTALRLKRKWKPFESLWNIDSLPGVYLPITKSVSFENIISLYPEVDFSKISVKYDMNISNECVIMEPTISDPIHYDSTVSVSELKNVYRTLIDFKYLSDKTTLDQWLYFSTGNEYNGNLSPILWNREVKALAMLINKALDNNNDKKKWQIASTIFRIKKGNRYEIINPDNLRRADHAIKADPNSPGAIKFHSLIFG